MGFGKKELYDFVMIDSLMVINSVVISWIVIYCV